MPRHGKTKNGKRPFLKKIPLLCVLFSSLVLGMDRGYLGAAHSHRQEAPCKCGYVFCRKHRYAEDRFVTGMFP
eukprot:3987533-Amphidinium_carterae.1